MKIKTTELTGPALDWVVAQVVHANLQRTYGEPVFNPKTKRIYQTEGLRQIGVNYSPSTNWAQGGPIIEQEKMTISYDEDGQTYSAYVSLFRQRGMSNRTRWRSGPTPLIAAMRAFCCSLLGEEVELPEKLK